MSGRRAFASNRGVCTPQLKPDGGQESRILSPFNTPIKKEETFSLSTKQTYKHQNIIYPQLQQPLKRCQQHDGFCSSPKTPERNPSFSSLIF